MDFSTLTLPDYAFCPPALSMASSDRPDYAICPPALSMACAEASSDAKGFGRRRLRESTSGKPNEAMAMARVVASVVLAGKPNEAIAMACVVASVVLAGTLHFTFLASRGFQ